jgi:hypothetical protein
MRIGFVLLAAIALTGCGGGGVSSGDALVACRNAIEDQLQSPSSADFNTLDTTIEDRDNGGYRITGVVDADNAFGASVRSDFSCTIGPSGNVVGAYLN